MPIDRRSNKFAFKKGTTRGTPEEPSTGDELKLISMTPPDGLIGYINNANNTGTDMKSVHETTVYEAQTGSITFWFFWPSLKIIEIFASIFGIYTFSADTPEAGANTHNIKMKGELETDIFHTMAYDHGAQTWGATSANFTGLTINITDRGFQVEASFLADFWGEQTSFSVPLSVTESPAHLGIHKLAGIYGRFRLNSQAGAGLASPTDDQLINNLTIEITRGTTELDVVAGETGISGVYDGEEPKVIVTAEYPSKTTANEDFLNAQQAGNEYKMDIQFISDVNIGVTSTPYTFLLNLPRMIPMEPNFDTASPMPVTVIFESYKALSNPTGMTDVYPYGSFINAEATLSGYPSS